MKKLALTVGDPCGVGPEIIKKWLEKNPEKLGEVALVGHGEFLDSLPECLEKVCVSRGEIFEPGKPSYKGAKVAFDALCEAAQGCRDGRFAGVVTAPVSKIWMVKVDPHFVGQTEFFESRWGGEAVMCFAGEKLIVSLVTWHIPLAMVPSSINAENLRRAVESAEILARKIRGAESPRIAVCGLNPHAGEGGILGREEIEVINPALEKLRAKIPNLSEALPPDTVFNRVILGQFDAAVSMYHDQGLGPLKSVDFDNAVNISMGLRHVRTSPDHGTGFDIAGRGIADEKSFARAVELARKLAE